MVSCFRYLQDSFSVILYALFNILSVVTIIVANKAVFKTINFHFPTVLMCVHTAVTFLGLSAANCLGLFERKSFPYTPLVLMAISFVFYNVISLANLNANTVSFYQISKIATTPAVMLLNYVIMRKTTSMGEMGAVAILLAGVSLTTLNEVSGTTLGFTLAAVATFGAAQQQLLIKKLQDDLDATANQLLLAYTPICVVMLAAASPLDHMVFNQRQETLVEWCESHLSVSSALVIVFSGCCGLLVSVSTFLLIKKVGPLTYNIVGHVKTISIVLSGWALFGDDMNAKKCAGIALALVGVLAYSYLKMQSRPEGGYDSVQTTDTAQEEEEELLGDKEIT